MASQRSATWKRVKFGEIAQCVNDRVDDPKAAGVDRYVGLEHLDPDSLSIRRWGTPDDVESTKLRFKPGDIIFGKRRAYQRKLAVAGFEGICSAHAMVLRARSNAVLPEFLPFFMQSDVFMERAVAISVGSLSPTINWKTLAAEEFALPPLADQRKLAVLLRAASDVREALDLTMRTASQAERAAVDHHVSEQVATFVDVGQLVRESVLRAPQDGNHGANHPKASDYRSNGVPFLMASDIRAGKVDFANSKFISTSLADSLRPAFRAMSGDILLTHKGTVGAVAHLTDTPTPYVMLTPQVTYYRVLTPQRLLPEYLAAVLSSSRVQQQLAALGRQSTRAFISITTQLKIRLPFPNMDEQRELVRQVVALRSAAESVARRRQGQRRLFEAAQKEMIA